MITDAYTQEQLENGMPPEAF